MVFIEIKYLCRKLENYIDEKYHPLSIKHLKEIILNNVKLQFSLSNYGN